MSRSYKIIDKANDEVVREEVVEKCTECPLHKELGEGHVRDWQCIVDNVKDGKHFNDVCKDVDFPDFCRLENNAKYYVNDDGSSWAVKSKGSEYHGCVCIFRYYPCNSDFYSEEEAKEKAEAECKWLNAKDKCGV